MQRNHIPSLMTPWEFGPLIPPIWEWFFSPISRIFLPPKEMTYNILEIFIFPVLNHTDISFLERPYFLEEIKKGNLESRGLEGARSGWNPGGLL